MYRLESPQHRAILYIRLLLHGLILGGFKQNWWPECSPLPVHLVYGSKKATTDVSEPISRFGYVREATVQRKLKFDMLDWISERA